MKAMSINRCDCDKKYNDKGGRRGKRDKYEKLRLDQIVDNLDCYRNRNTRPVINTFSRNR